MTKIPFVARLLVINLSVTIAVGGLSIVLLYNTVLKDKERALTDYVIGMAAVIDIFVQYSPKDDTLEKVTQETLKLAGQAFENLDGIGESGAIFILSQTEDGLKVLVEEKREIGTENGIDQLLISSASIRLSEGFRGNTDAFLAIDSHGHEVLLAYAPISSINLVLVALTHKDEVIETFIDTVIIVIVIGVALVAVGVIATYGPTSKLVKKSDENAKRFKEFADTATDWYWEMDQDLRFIAIGRGERPGDEFEYTKYVGMTRPEVTVDDTSTQKWRDHQEDLDAHRLFKNFQYDLNVERQRRTMSVSGFPFFDGDGKFIGYRGTGRDVTEFIKNRHQLQLAEAQMRAAFESIAVGIVQIDAVGTIEIVNPMVSKIFGYEVSELIGRNVSMLMPEPDRSQHDQYLEGYRAGAPPKIIGYGREVKGLRKDGDVFPLHLGIAKMEIMDEVHYVGSLTDLTTEKQLEQQLRRAQKMDAIGQLTGGIAHEFNNLLGIIVGNLDLAQRRLTDDSRITKYIGKAQSAAERGYGLTRRLLNFSRQAPEENQIVDINETIRLTSELISHSLSANISVELLLSDDTCTATINIGDFEDSLINLAVNARDAMPNGGIFLIETRNIQVDHPVSDVGLLASGDYVELSVSDTGEGMNSEVASRVFEPFYTTKAHGKGTGLGMAMVYGFVQRSKGTISVYSEEGVGTTFKIRLPRAEQDDTQVSRTLSEDVTKHLPGGTETILIVDDEVELANIAQTVLDELGYKTVIVHNAPDAVTALRTDTHFDIMFSDVVMPGGMNGYELADTASVLRPGIKILLASGFTAAAAEHALKDRKSFYPLLNKPYTNMGLAQEIRRILDLMPAA